MARGLRELFVELLRNAGYTVLEIGAIVDNRSQGPWPGIRQELHSLLNLITSLLYQEGASSAREIRRGIRRVRHHLRANPPVRRGERGQVRERRQVARRGRVRPSPVVQRHPTVFPYVSLPWVDVPQDRDSDSDSDDSARAGPSHQ